MQTAEQRNWWQRNWKWFVPSGCLVIVLLVGGFVAAIFWFVFALMKHSDVYAHALQAARASEAVRAEIGSPIEEGWYATGSVQETGPSGSAELAIPVSGPRGSGTIYVEARKSTGEWNYARLVFESDVDHKRIDLAAGPAPTLAPPASGPGPNPGVPQAGFPGLPADASVLLARMAACKQFSSQAGGEGPVREEDVKAAMSALKCELVQADAAAIRQKYAADSAVQDALRTADEQP